MIPDLLRNACPNSTYVKELFGVATLYTNVSNDAAIPAILENTKHK